MSDKKSDHLSSCPVCGSPLRVCGKYSTVYVYECTGQKCHRKFNQDALKAKKHETTKHDSK